MPDEGQMAGSKAGIAMHLARELNIERRWVVSGSEYQCSYGCSGIM